MLKKLLSNTMIAAMAPQIPKFAGLFVLRWTTPHLTPEDYGIFGTIFAYDGALSAFRELGVGMLLMRSYFAYPNRWKIVWQQLMGLSYAWSIIFSFFQVLLLYFIIPKEAAENKWLIIGLIVIPALLFDRAILFGSLVQQYTERFQYIALCSVLSGLVSIVFNYILIATFKMGYMGLLLAPIMGKIVQYFFYAIPLWFKHHITPIFRFKKRRIMQNLKIALPTIPHYYSSYFLNSSDRVVMDAMHIPQAEIGLYNTAYNMGNYFFMLTDALGKAFSATNGKLWFKGTEQSKIDRRNLIFLFQGAFLMLTLTACLWMKEFFIIFFRNPDFQVVYPLAILIVMGYNYRPLYWASINALIYEKKTQFIWRITFTAGISNVILNLVGIPIWGYKFAAISTFISLFINGFLGFFVTAYKELKDAYYYPFVWMVVFIVLTIFAYLCKDLEIMWKGILTACFMGVAAYIFYKSKHYFQNIDI